MFTRRSALLRHRGDFLQSQRIEGELRFLLRWICGFYIAGGRRSCTGVVLLLAIAIARCNPGFRGSAHDETPSHTVEKEGRRKID